MIIVKFRKKGQTPKFQNIKCLKDTMIRNSVKVPPPPPKKKKNKLQIFGYTLFFMQNIKKIPTRIENNNWNFDLEGGEVLRSGWGGKYKT